MPSHKISFDEARRIALAAQGFDRPRPKKPVGLDAIRAVIRRLGLLQIDYVNVVVPSQYQVVFARLGPYERALLDDLVYRKREFTEQWAHEASIVPVESWALLAHRRETHRVRPYGFEEFLSKNVPYVDWVLEQIRERGALTADDVLAPEGVARSLAHSWFGTVPRAVLEAHFGRGLLAVADRKPNFARSFDLVERVIAHEHHASRMESQEAQRTLLLHAARAMGVGTGSDLADYFRMSAREARPRIAELQAAGALESIRVEGWREPAYLHPEAKCPRRIEARSLLSPFDPVVWFRPRTARLFGFEYRFEIFVPAEKLRWGRYVLPFLLGDRLVARVDLKADRIGRRLKVNSAFLETGVDPGEAAEALARELATMARWLSLDSVAVGRRGDFARALGAAVRGSR